MTVINLDHISSNPMRPEVKEAMIAAIEHDYGNPSSPHRLGDEATEALDKARESVAALINAPTPKEVVFTASGTESINHAIKGVALANAKNKGYQDSKLFISQILINPGPTLKSGIPNRMPAVYGAFWPMLLKTSSDVNSDEAKFFVALQLSIPYKLYVL